MKRNAPSGSKPGPKGKGVFRIVEFENRAGSNSFRVTGWTMEAVRVRENFPSHAEAVARKQQLETEAANVNTAGQMVFTRLSPTQVNEAESAQAALERAGHKSLGTAADFFIRNYRDPLKRIRVSEAVEKFLAEKRSARRRERYLKDLKHELAYLTSEHGRKFVHEIQKEDLVAVIDVDGRGPERQNNIRKDFRTFFNWCLANGYTQGNPAELVAQKTVERGEIEVLPIKKATELLKAAAGYKDGKLVPYVALATFCAIRPDELARLSWDEIDLAEKQVTITASAAKKRGRRVVDVPDNCVAWLRRHAARRTPIKGVNWRREFDAVKEQVGFGSPAPEDASDEKKRQRAGFKPWPQDVLRHTGISCHYRKHSDEGKTAAWAGNSPDMIHAHYRALVSAKDANAFFEIAPKRNGGKKIIDLPMEAKPAKNALAKAVEPVASRRRAELAG